MLTEGLGTRLDLNLPYKEYDDIEVPTWKMYKFYDDRTKLTNVVSARDRITVELHLIRRFTLSWQTAWISTLFILLH